MKPPEQGATPPQASSLSICEKTWTAMMFAPFATHRERHARACAVARRDARDVRAVVAAVRASMASPRQDRFVLTGHLDRTTSSGPERRPNNTLLR